jgi:hypothetical protein
MTLKAHTQTQHEYEAATADCRFLTVKDLQDGKPLDYVYPPELLEATRNKFIERARNLNLAANVTERDE